MNIADNKQSTDWYCLKGGDTLLLGRFVDQNKSGFVKILRYQETGIFIYQLASGACVMGIS